MLTAAAYDIHVEQLLERMRRFHGAMEAEGIPYRIVGGMATFIHVYERQPIKARLTQDVDVLAVIPDTKVPQFVDELCRAGCRHLSPDPRPVVMFASWKC